MNIIENMEKEQMAKLMEGKNLPNFKSIYYYTTSINELQTFLSC